MARGTGRAGRIAALGCAAWVLLAQPASAAQRDFGDAPDGAAAYQGVTGHFPSLASSRGPTDARVGALRLGRGESGERDSRQIDLDPSDDGFSSQLTACTVSHAWFVVNAARLPARLRKRGHVAYLNAWFDWNRDGRWAGATACQHGNAAEWGVRNVPIDLGAFAKKPTQVVRVDVAAGPQVFDLWQRATLTLDQRVKRQGARGGRFRYGETEDYGPRVPASATTQKPGGNPAPASDDDPDPVCRPWDPGTGQLGPPGMPAFIDHGQTAIFDVQVLSRNGDAGAPFGTVLVADGNPIVLLGSPPLGIVTGFPFGAGPAPWNSIFGLVVTSTAVDHRKLPVQIVVIPVSIAGTQVGLLAVDCPVIVAHETLLPASGTNTFQPQPGGTETQPETTIDTTVGPPTITIGGQSGGGGSSGSTTVTG